MTTRNTLLSSSTLTGDSVRNSRGEDLGKIEDLMIDTTEGKIVYAVLSFGGVLGIGNKLFAIPWSALMLSTEEHRFVVDIDKQRLKDAPGFDKDNWPDFGDPQFQQTISEYYAAGR